ncbi:MAG TPA: hypothetical protein VF530_08095 [Planctomycetota bacterium]
MPDRIRTLAKRIAETRPVQSRRRHELYAELQALRAELEPRTPPEGLNGLDAALLLMEFTLRSDDVATSETFQVIAGLVATIDEGRLGPGAATPSRPVLRRVPPADVVEHHDLRLTQGYLLGTILLQAGVISADSLGRALQLQASSHQPLGQCLVQLGAVSAEQIESALTYQDRLREGGRGPRAVPHTPPGTPAPVAPSHVPSHVPSHAPSPPALRGELRLSSKQRDYLQSMNAQVLGEVLIRLGSITREQLAHALAVQRAAGIHIGEALVETGAASWEQIKKALDVQRQLRRYAA